MKLPKILARDRHLRTKRDGGGGSSAPSSPPPPPTPLQKPTLQYTVSLYRINLNGSPQKNHSANIRKLEGGA